MIAPNRTKKNNEHFVENIDSVKKQNGREVIVTEVPKK